LNRIATGTAATAVQFTVIGLGSILTTPILLSSLGISKLGIFVLLMMLTPLAGSLSVADLGMEGALLARLATAQARDAPGQRRALLRRGITYYAIVATVLGLTIFVTRAPLAVWLTKGAPHELPDVRAATTMLSLTVFVQFLTVPFAAHGLGAGSFTNTRLFDSLFFIGHYAGVGVVATSTSNLRTLMLVPFWTGSVRLATHGFRTSRFERRAGRVGRERPDPGLIKEASALFVSRIVGLIYRTVDQALIVRFLTPADLAKYDLASKPATLLQTSSSVASSTLFRETAYAHVKGGDPAAKKLILGMARYVALVLLPIFGLLEGQLDFLYRAWLRTPPANVVALGRLFLVVMVFFPFAHIAGAAMVGLRRVGRTLFAPVLGSVFNVVVSVILVRHVGVAGVVIGTIVGQAISMSGYAWIVGRMEGSIPRAERNALLLVYPAAGLACLAHALIARTLGSGSTSFILSMVLTALHLLLMYRACLTEAERSTLQSWRRVVRTGG
jgi:O-antigen/teichoic acid export membrane protein